MPPPLGGILIDGANVIATSTARADQRLELAVRWFRGWRPDLRILVLIDHAAIGRCSAAAKARLQELLDGRAPDLGYAVGPRGESADPLLLRQALRDRALVVSNDRYHDHEALRRGVVTVQFECAADRFEPYPEATWFTPEGGAARVAMAALRAADAGDGMPRDR